MSFWGELKRRNVFKVGVAYVIVAWLIVQVANTFFPLLSFPKWTVPLVAVLVILGFPLALLFAWAFELTPDGVKWTKDIPKDESITHLTGQRLNYMLIGVIVLGAVYILFDNYYLDRRAIQTETDSRVSELAPAVEDVEGDQITIAVLPFSDLSPEKDQEYFADGLSEELLNSLSKIPGLSVTSRTSAFSFKGGNKTIQEIADVLGVEHILEGSVRKAGDSLRITTQLIRVKDDTHLWSDTYNRELKDIFDVQEDIARTVADELKVALGIDIAIRQPGGTDNLEAYEFYLLAKGQVADIRDGVNRALESIDAAIALDPEFALAWALKASIHSEISVYGSPDFAVSERDAGFRAAEKAVDLEPDLVEGYLSMGFIHTCRGEFIEAELAFRKVFELTSATFSSDGMLYAALHYVAVGNLKKAHGIMTRLRQSDPLNMGFRSFYLRTLYLVGDRQGADAEYERGKALFGDPWIDGLKASVGTGLDIEDKLSFDHDDVALSPIDREFVSIFKEYKKSPEETIMRLRRMYNEGENQSNITLLTFSHCAASFGEPELAMAIIDRMIAADPSGLFHVWSPVFKGVRQLPRFKELVREVGLIDFWNKFGWPDICRPLENGDFVCD